LTVACTLGNVGSKLAFNALVDTDATGYSFIDTVIAQTVCERLQIEPIRLLKPKPLKGFDGRPGRDITHAIYPTMTIHDHVETVTPMLITHLGNHPIILGKPWMNKHHVMLDMTNDRIVFGRCCNSGPQPSTPTLPKPVEPVKTLLHLGTYYIGSLRTPYMSLYALLPQRLPGSSPDQNLRYRNLLGKKRR